MPRDGHEKCVWSLIQVPSDGLDVCSQRITVQYKLPARNLSVCFACQAPAQSVKRNFWKMMSLFVFNGRIYLIYIYKIYIYIICMYIYL